MFSGIGGGLAPLVFSVARDLSGSFAIVLQGAAALTASAGLCLLTVGRYRYFRSQPAGGGSH